MSAARPHPSSHVAWGWPIRLGPEDLGTFEAASGLEWLETNGLGGWASSTVAGAHTRRYHGLLVAALRPPLGRVVLLSRLDETLVIGTERFELAANQFPGAVHPRGHELLEAFERGWFPVFRYRAGDARIEKTVAALHGENTTLILFRLTVGARPIELELRPFLADRDYHSLRRADDRNPTASFEEGLLRIEPVAGDARLFLHVPGAAFEPEPDWWYGFEYARERERGLEDREDLWTPGILRVHLEPGASICVVASTRDPTTRDGPALLAAEEARRASLLDLLPVRDEVTVPLALAADQFIVRRAADLRTVIAGYHWFGDWGRDTLISLPGLTLATGRHGDARLVLRALAAHVSEGLIPNRFPDHGEAPEYNTADATLWFFVALWKYGSHTNDWAFVAEWLPILREVLAWHRGGTRYGIRQDEDGLLAAGEPGVQLTWMDARVGDKVVTPRQGKPVEVNALWYNALRILGRLEAMQGDPAAAAGLDAEADRVARRFGQVFWGEERGYLFDVVDGEARDAALRPNQLLAVSLPFSPLSEAQQRAVLEVVERHLLTPFGLRSLARSDPAYRPRYEGDVFSRDSAYHQGTVWGWLLGPYLTALVRVRGEAGRAAARAIIEGALPHLSEACVGTYSEIFDAEPDHLPRGAIAQAWSVAELLRAYLEDVLDVRPDARGYEPNR